MEPDRRERALRHAGQRQRAGPRSRRILERFGGGGGGGARRFRARQRHRRLGAAAGQLLRHPRHCAPPTAAFRSTACARSRRASIPAAGSRATPACSSAWGACCCATPRPRARRAACWWRRTRSRSPTTAAPAALKPALDTGGRADRRAGERDGGRRAADEVDGLFPVSAGRRSLGGARRVGDAGQAAVRARDQGALRLGGDRRPAGRGARARAARGDHAPHGRDCCETTRCSRCPARRASRCRGIPRPRWWTGLRARALPMLCIAGLARLPQVSLPLATLDGCPLGLSLIAARGNDTLLLELAKKLI